MAHYYTLYDASGEQWRYYPFYLRLVLSSDSDDWSNGYFHLESLESAVEYLEEHYGVGEEEGSDNVHQESSDL